MQLLRSSMKIVRLFDGGTKMAKNKKDLDLADSSNLNQIKKSTNVVFNILFVILALTCIFRSCSSLSFRSPQSSQLR